MKPQDIDKIANLVVGSLSGVTGAGLLGCGAVSSGQEYQITECTDPLLPFYICASFECGGQGEFLCCAGFDCIPSFWCPGPAIFGCGNDVEFHCPPAPGFECGANDTFKPTVSGCGLPAPV